MEPHESKGGAGGTNYQRFIDVKGDFNCVYLCASMESKAPGCNKKSFVGERFQSVCNVEIMAPLWKKTFMKD